MRWLASGMGVVAIIAVAPHAYAAAAPTLEELAAHSDVIVVGKVVEVQLGRRGAQRVTVQVERFLKQGVAGTVPGSVSFLAYRLGTEEHPFAAMKAQEEDQVFFLQMLYGEFGGGIRDTALTADFTLTDERVGIVEAKPELIEQIAHLQAGEGK